MKGWNPSCLSPLACAMLPLCLIWESLQLHIHNVLLLSPLCFLLESGIFIGNNLFFCDSCAFFSIFFTFFITTNPLFHSHVASRHPKRFTSVCGKNSNIPSVGFACVCVCFHTKLLGHLEAFRGLFSNFCEALAYQGLLSLERGTQSQPMHMEGETGAKRKALWFPQTTRWGLTCTSEPSCQQPIESSPSDCSFSQKTSEGNLASYWNKRGGQGGVLLCTQLVVSAINHHSAGITGAVFWASVWPDVWPRCDYSLG